MEDKPLASLLDSGRLWQEMLLTENIIGIDQFQDARRGIDGRVVQIEPGELRVDYTELTFDDLALRHWSLNRRVAVEDCYDPGRTSFILTRPTEEASGRWCGQPVNGYRLLVVRGGREHFCVIPRNWSDIDISVEDATLLELGLVDEAFLTLTVTPEAAQFTLPPDFAGKLFSALHALLEAKNRMDKPGSAAEVRDWILAHLGAAIKLATPSSLSREIARPHHYRQVREALAFWAESGEPGASVETVCAAGGTHPRAMQRAFQTIFGLSPYQYSIRSRLTKARSRLIDPRDHSTITAIAHDLGFPASSDFARYYFRQFGERPSDTRLTRL